MRIYRDVELVELLGSGIPRILRGLTAKGIALKNSLTSNK